MYWVSFQFLILSVNWMVGRHKILIWGKNYVLLSVWFNLSDGFSWILELVLNSGRHRWKMRRRAADYRRPVRRRLSCWIWGLLVIFSVAGFALFVLHHNQHQEDLVEQPVLVSIEQKLFPFQSCYIDMLDIILNIIHTTAWQPIIELIKILSTFPSNYMLPTLIISTIMSPTSWQSSIILSLLHCVSYYFFNRAWIVYGLLPVWVKCFTCLIKWKSFPSSIPNKNTK